MKTRSRSTADVRLEWGHPLLTPDGSREISIPNVFEQLKQLGLIERDRETGLFRLRHTIYEFLHSDYEGLMGPLRRILGRALEGSDWVRCKCGDCRRLEQDLDRTKLPHKRPAWNNERADYIAAMQKAQQKQFSRRARS